MVNNDQIKAFIWRKKALFWYIDPQKLENINMAFLTETILNYGDLQDVKELISLVGIKNIAQIFYSSVENKRNNYFPDVANYFNLYFQKHA